MASKLLFACFLVIINMEIGHGGEFANVTLVQSGVQEGAVCLDGSPPGYAMAAGSGCGSNNWLIYLEGGAWCANASDCFYRAKGMLGSTVWRTKMYLSGILDGNKSFNPDFYDWNRVYVLYCDGSSFLGDAEEVDPVTKVFYRGSRVFGAIMEDLLSKGMDAADNVLLTGTSAGGLATILHCDSFRELVPAGRVKCFSDSGFFLHASNFPGAMSREDYFYRVIKLHGLERFLPESCTYTQTNLSLCMFPENLVDDLQTPLFLLESSFDPYQLHSLITPYIGGGADEWYKCLFKNLTFCSSTQLEIMREFHETFIQALYDLDSSPSRGLGMFIHTCYQHGHIYTKLFWKCSCVMDKTIADAVGDWYFDRPNAFQLIDTSHSLPRNCTPTLGDDAFNKKCLQLIG